MSWPLEYPGASPETWIDWYRRELAEMTEPIEKDPHPLLAENRQLRAEIERLQAALNGVLAREMEWARHRGLSDCRCINLSRGAEREYERGECPHQKARRELEGK